MAPSAIVALCLLALASAAPQNLQNLQCATSCDPTRQATVGVIGKTYSFNYNVQSSVKLVGVNEGITQGGFTGKVDVSRINPCELAIKFTSSNEGVKVSKHPLVVSIIGNGQFEKVCTHPEDDSESINIKKGIASAIQYGLPSFAPTKKQIVPERSVLGTCPTAYSVENNGQNWVVNKKIVHGECQEHYYSHSEIPSILSKSPMPIQASKSVCTQVYTSSKVPQTISCKDTKVVRPAYGVYKYIEATQESTLQFTSESTDMSILSSIKGHQLLNNKLIYDHSMPAKNPALVGKLDAVLSNACKMVQGQGHQESASTVNKAIELLRHVPDDAFVTVLNKIRAGDYCADFAKLEALYMDAIAFISEPGALKVIAQEVSAGRVTGGRTALYTAALHLLSKPTVAHVAALTPIAAMENPSSTFILAAASVVNKHCTHHACENTHAVKNILNLLTAKLANQCTPAFSKSNPITVITTLKTLGNIGHLASEHAEKVIHCAKTEGVETNVRFAATMVLKGAPCKAPVKKALQDIVLNKDMNTEVRIGSYLAAIKCVNEGDLQEIITKIMADSNKQVHLFVVSHLNNLKKTSWPLKTHLQKVLANMNVPAYNEWNIFKYSRNIEMSFNAPILGVGAAVDSNVVFTPESYIPRLVNLGLDMNLLGSIVNIGEVGARVEGLDPIIKDVFGPESYLHKTPLNNIIKDTPMFIKQNGAKILNQLENIIRQNKFVDIKSLIQSVTEFLKVNNIKLPKMDLYAKLMGQEYAFLSLADPMREVNINHVVEIITSAVVDALVAAKDLNVNTARAAHLHVDYTIPTIQGVPLKINLKSTAVTGIHVQSKLDANNNALLKFIPSVSIAIDGYIGFGAIIKHGLKMKNAIYSTNGLALHVSLKNGQDLEMKLELPEKMELINVKSEFYQITVNNLMDEQKIYPSNIKDARIAKKHCFTGLHITGLHICVNMNIPDILKSDSLPLGMPAQFSIHLQKHDVEMKGYRVQAALKNKANKKVLKMIVGTYGSASSTESSFKFAYTKEGNAYQTAAEIKSLWFTSKIEGHFIHQAELISMQILANHQFKAGAPNAVACKFDVKKVAIANGNEYHITGFAGLTEILADTHKFLGVRVIHAKNGDFTNADVIVNLDTSVLSMAIGFGMDVPSKAPWFAVIRKVELKSTVGAIAVEGLVLRKMPGQYQNIFAIKNGGSKAILIQATHKFAGNVFANFNWITEASAKIGNKAIETTFSFKHENAAIDTICEWRIEGAKVFNIEFGMDVPSKAHWFVVIRKVELKATVGAIAVEGLVLRKMPGQYQNIFAIQHGGSKVIFLQAMHKFAGNVFANFNWITDASAKIGNKAIGTTFSFKHENAVIDTIWEWNIEGAKVFNIIAKHSMESNLYTTILEIGLPTFPKTVKLSNAVHVVEFLSYRIMTDMYMDNTALLHIAGPVSLEISKEMIKHNMDLKISGAFGGKFKVMNAALLSFKKIQYTFDMRHATNPITMIDINIDRTNAAQTTAKAIVHIPVLVKAEYGATVTAGMLHTTMNTFILPKTPLARRFKGYADLNLKDQKMKLDFFWDAENDNTKKIALNTGFNFDHSMRKVMVQGDLAVTTLVYGFKLEAMMASPFAWFLGTSGVELAVTAPSNKVIVVKALCAVDHAGFITKIKPLVVLQTLSENKYEIAGLLAIKKLPAFLNFEINSEINVNIPQIQKIIVATNVIHDDANGACAIVFKTKISGPIKPIAFEITHSALGDKYTTLFKVQHGSTVGSIAANVALISGLKAFDITVDASLPFAFVKALSLKTRKTAGGAVTWTFSKDQVILAKLHYLMASWTAHTLNFEWPAVSVATNVAFNFGLKSFDITFDASLPFNAVKVLSVRAAKTAEGAVILAFTKNQIVLAKLHYLMSSWTKHTFSVHVPSRTIEFFASISGNEMIVKVFPEKNLSSKMLKTIIRVTNKVESVHIECFVTAPSLPNEMRIAADIVLADPIMKQIVNVDIHFPTAEFKTLVNGILEELKKIYLDLVKDGLIPDMTVVLKELKLVLKELPKYLNNLKMHITNILIKYWNIVKNWTMKMWETYEADVVALMEVVLANVRHFWEILKMNIPILYNDVLAIMKKVLNMVHGMIHTPALHAFYEKVILTTVAEIQRLANKIMALPAFRFESVLKILRNGLSRIVNNLRKQLIQLYPAQYNIILDFYNKVVLTMVAEIKALVNKIMNLKFFHFEPLWKLLKNELPTTFANLRKQLLNAELTTVLKNKFNDIKFWSPTVHAVMVDTLNQVIMPVCNIILDFHNKFTLTTIIESVELVNKIMNLPSFRIEALWKLLKNELPAIFAKLRKQLVNAELTTVVNKKFNDIKFLLPTVHAVMVDIHNIILDFHNKVLLTTVTELIDLVDMIINLPSFRFEPLWKLLKNELPNIFAKLRKQLHNAELTTVIIKKYNVMKLWLPSVHAAMVNIWARVIMPVHNWALKILQTYEADVIAIINTAQNDVLHCWGTLKTGIPILYHDILVIVRNTEMWKMLHGKANQIFEKFPVQYNMLLDVYNKVILTTVTEIKTLANKIMNLPSFRFEAVWRLLRNELPTIFAKLRNQLIQLFPVHYNILVDFHNKVILTTVTEIKGLVNKIMNLPSFEFEPLWALLENELPKVFAVLKNQLLNAELVNVFMPVVNIILDFYNKVILTTVNGILGLVNKIMNLPALRFEAVWKLLKTELPTIFANLKKNLLNAELIAVIIKKFNDMKLLYPIVYGAMLDLWVHHIKPVWTELVNILLNLMHINFTNITQLIEHLVKEVPALWNKIVTHLMNKEVVHMVITLIKKFIEENPMIGSVYKAVIEVCHKIMMALKVDLAMLFEKLMKMPLVKMIVEWVQHIVNAKVINMGFYKTFTTTVHIIVTELFGVTYTVAGDRISAVVPLPVSLPTLRTILTTVLVHIPTAIADIMNSLVAVIDTIPVLVTKLMDQVNAFAHFGAKHIPVIIKMVKTHVPKFINEFVPVLNNFIENIPVFINELVPVLNNFIENMPVLIRQIKEQITVFVKFAAEQIPVIVKIVKAHVPFINELIPVLNEWIALLMNTEVAKFLKAKITVLVTIITEHVNAIVKLLAKHIPIIVKIVKTHVLELINELVPVINNFIKNIPVFINKLVPVINNFIANIPVFINELVPTLNKLIANIPVIINQVKEHITIFVMSVAEQIPVIVKTVKGRMLKLINDLVPVIKEWVAFLMNTEVAKFVMAKIELVIKMYPAQLNAIKVYFENVFGLAVEAITLVFKKVMAIPIIKKVVEYIWSLIYKKGILTSMVSTMFSISSSVISQSLTVASHVPVFIKLHTPSVVSSYLSHLIQ